MLEGFRCSDGKAVKWPGCLDCKDSCLSLPIIRTIASLEFAGEKERPSGFTVTMLTGCPRQLALQKRIPYYEPPLRCWWKVRGTIIHSLLEGTIPGWIAEKRLTTEVDGVTISGRIDTFDSTTGTLWDYKTLGDKGLRFLRDGAKPEHVEQVNKYYYLARKQNPPWEIKQIKIAYVTLMEIVETGGLLVEREYRVSPPLSHPTMIGEPEVVKEYENSNKRVWEAKYSLPSVEIWPLKKTETLIREQLGMLAQAFGTETINDMPRCPVDQDWRCKFCPQDIQELCDQPHGNIIPVKHRSPKKSCGKCGKEHSSLPGDMELCYDCFVATQQGEDAFMEEQHRVESL